MTTIRLTAAQAMVRYLSAQRNEDGDPLIPGCWAIFGHGNVAGIGEALHAAGDAFPTWRGHYEQGMAHAAIAFGKAKNRRQVMAVTTSIGPGALNLVTAGAMAHVNRLPVLFLPGDVFADRAPDPVLQQLEDFNDGTTTNSATNSVSLAPHQSSSRSGSSRAVPRLRVATGSWLPTRSWFLSRSSAHVRSSITAQAARRASTTQRRSSATRSLR